MDNLLLSLVVGVGLALAVFVLIYKFSRLSGKQVAALVAMGVAGIYMPWALIAWPGADIFAIHLALYMMTPYALGIITTHWEIREREGESDTQKRWFHWGPATMVGFFVTIAVVDAIIITLAGKGMSSDTARALLPEPRAGGEVSSFFPGTVSHDYQKKEALYNEYLAQLERQRERGWQVRKGFMGTPQVGVEAMFRVQVLDREGEALGGAKVQVQILRPSDSREDRILDLNETAAGVYEAPVSLPLPGVWDIVIRITRGEDLHELRGMTSIQAAEQDKDPPQG